MGVVDTGLLKSEKDKPKLKRIDKDKLEQMYITNPLVSNGVDSVVTLFMSAGYQMEYPSKKVENNWKDFFSTIKFNNFVEDLFKHECIFGDGWGELVGNKSGTKIVDLVDIDPKTMDYMKDSQSNGKIIVDSQGNPEGYVQKFEDTTRKPKDFTLDEIAHFTYKTVGSRWYGIGIIEPIYKTGLNKLNVQEGLAESVYRHGFPIIKAACGDLNHEPTPEKIQNILNKLKDISYNSELALPYYTTVEILEAKRTAKLDVPLNYFIDQEVTGLGIPKAFVTGSGEDVNRSTLQSQSYIMEKKFRAIHERFSNQMTVEVFNRINEKNDMGGVPKMTFNPLNVEDLNSIADRLTKYAEKGLLDPSDASIQEYIRTIEDLPKE